MNSLYIWFQNNLDVVFFVYGLAFIIMGLAILMQPVRDSKFKLANVLWLLASFGLIHGTNEWMDGWSLLKGREAITDVTRVSVLAVSYLFLFEFGRQLFRLNKDKYPHMLKRSAELLTWVTSPLIVLGIFIGSAVSHDFWELAAIWIRYLLGFPGGMLISAGFFLYYKYEKQALDPLGVKKYFLFASGAFFLYGILGGFIVNEGSHFPSNLVNTESFHRLTRFPVQTFRAVCAIAAGWATIGMLKIFNVETIKKLEEEIEKRKRTEAEREELTVQLLRSNERLAQLAVEDSHTGLFNYRYLVEIIEAELNRTKRTGEPLSVIMMDIDYFKSINDVYGHTFGDLILKQFAAQIKNTVRRYDIVVRYGGEEFVIISPGLNLKSVEALGHRILEAIGLAVFGDDKHTVKLKLSIAVVSYPFDFALKGMDLIEAADGILSKVKEKGGNRVYCSEDVKNDKSLGHGKDKEASNVNVLKDKIHKLTRRANQGLIEATAAYAKTIELKDQ